MILRRLIFISLFLLIPSLLQATTTQVNCSSASTVNTALTNAASGDTIQCTTGGWSSGTVTVPSNKNITLDGNSVSVTGGVIDINGSGTYQARVTGFAFSGSFSMEMDGTSIANGFESDLPWRVDHSTWNCSTGGTKIVINWSAGLIDHLTFTNVQAAEETIHIFGSPADNTTGWTNAHTPGSAKAVYFENNTATGAQGNSSCLFQMYYGGRVVSRFNTLNSIMMDVHGNVDYSGRWWEFYKNSSTGSSVMCLRGGSGIIFGNTGDASAYFNEENNACSGGATGCDQVGRGQNWALYPAYYYGNSTIDFNLNVGGCSPAISGAIVANVDVYDLDSYQGTSLPGTCTTGQGYWKTDEGSWNQSGSGGQGVLYKCTATNTWTSYYTPYTYPHPLQGGGGE